MADKRKPVKIVPKDPKPKSPKLGGKCKITPQCSYPAGHAGACATYRL